MNSNEFNFDDLGQFQLSIDIDILLDRYGLVAVMEELEARALKDNLEYFDEKIRKNNGT